jgi:hypothetical protein
MLTGLEPGLWIVARLSRNCSGCGSWLGPAWPP